MSFPINEIYNENCLETMSRMEDNFIDLIVTSPPYDDLRNYHGYSFDFEKIAKELYRVTKDGGVVVWVVGDATKNGTESGTSFKQALYFKEIGFNLHDTMIYAKSNYVPLTHNRYEQQFEYMFILSKNKPKTFNPIKVKTVSNRISPTRFYHTASGDRTLEHKIGPTKEEKIKGNVWTYSVGQTRGKNHPAPFPDKLAEDHIISWSNENDIVYDPFFGSGTVAFLANKLNRNWIGSEISKEYVDSFRQRFTKPLY